MAIQAFAFNPPDGLKNSSYSPTIPESETAIRGQIQGISNQLRDFLNSITPSLYTKDEINNILAGLVLGQVSPGSILDNMLSNDLGQIKDTVRNIQIYSTIELNRDVNGIYTEVQLKRKDGTLLYKSVLSGGTSPNYTTKTETYYLPDGTTIKETINYTRQYDAYGKCINEVIL